MHSWTSCCPNICDRRRDRRHDVGATQTLGRFAAEYPFDGIPADVLHLSARCLLDYVGISLGGWAEPAVQIACSVAHELGGREDASLLGGGRTSLLHAATVNGIASHVLDFDDTHEPTILHGTGPVMSAALAAGEARGARGVDLLAAHAIGFEVAARVALAVHPEHYDQGFHVTGTAGVFGAAAAAGRLLGLSADQMAHALSTAAAQAAGLREMFGSMSKSLHAGKAAANGLYSALLARGGWISAAEGIEGRRGFWAVLSSRMEPQRATGQLGESWELRRNGLKPYACGVVSHPTIDAMRRIRDSAQLSADEIVDVRATVNPYVLELMGKREPSVGLEGKFSIFHCAAIAYLDGTARTRQFTDDAVRRSDVIELRQKVRAEVDATLPTSAARVEVAARDGRVWKESVTAATGTPDNPMTDDDITEKFLSLVEGRLPPARARETAARCLAAADLGDVRELLSLVAGR
ncbi:MAG: MmgE/PrpD family protein [Chloroflexi bacterium]|nr:MmgE/PrpD family protein [Chloroflexota bacterium]